MPLPIVRPPADDAFTSGDDFLVAPDIEAIGEMLRERHNLPVEPTIAYRWKRKGGKKGGLSKRGSCQKLSGPAKHFGRADFLVWLAADTCRDAKYSQEQYVALIFHELNFVGVDYDDETGNATMVTRGVDFEGFLDEIRFYGLWEDNLAKFAEVAEQAPLWPYEGDGEYGGVSSVTLSTGDKSVTMTGEEFHRAAAAAGAD